MEKIQYQEFLRRFRKQWEQGEHVLISGPTGSGKTYIAEDIKDLRSWLVVIASKKSDETLDGYKGFKKKEKWPPEWNEKLILFWRKPRNIEDLQGMREAIYEVLSDVFLVGGWSVYFDDLAFISGTLRMDKQLRMMYTQVRSNNTSLIASVQRPKRVPIECISQSKYILLFPTQDDKDVETVAQYSGQDTRRLKYRVSQLGEHEFLFIEHGKDPVHVEKRSIA